MTRGERTRMKTGRKGSAKRYFILAAGIFVLIIACFGVRDLLTAVSRTAPEQTYPQVKLDDLKSAIVMTAASFGINPDDIRWENEQAGYSSSENGHLNEVRISTFYPKLNFHRELMKNLVGTGFTISDCLESPDGEYLDFRFLGLDKSEFAIRLISDRKVMPLATHLSIIIDGLQSQSRTVQEELLGLGVMYAYVLTPGIEGFAKTREGLLSGGQQVLYEIPLQEAGFVSMMSAAAPAMGLKKVRNLQQAVDVLQRLTGDFKYLFARASSKPPDAKMAEVLGRAGFVIFSAGENLGGSTDAFMASGGKLVQGVLSFENYSEEYLRLQLIEYHRKILSSDNWGIVTIKAGREMASSIRETAQQLMRLNCKTTPVSQYLLRIG